MSTEPDRIVNDVIRGLLEGRYEPGQRLIEADLTATYGLSRGPVREALNRLCAVGLVELSKQRGAQIRTHTIDEAIDVLVVVDGLARTAVRLAARNIESPGARGRLAIALAELEQAAAEPGRKRFDGATQSLFSTIYELSNNTELQRIYPTVRIHIVNAQFRAVARSLDRQVAADYRRIAGAILAGKETAAEAAVKNHMKKAIDAMDAYRKASLA